LFYDSVINTALTNWRHEGRCKVHDFLMLGGKQHCKHMWKPNLQPDIPMNW